MAKAKKGSLLGRINPVSLGSTADASFMIEKVDEKILRITKIERVIIQYMDDVIYNSNDWELIEYQKECRNKQVA